MASERRRPVSMKVRSTRTRASQSIDEIRPSRDRVTPSFSNQTIPIRHAKTFRKYHSSRRNLSSSENPPTRPSRRRGRPTARRVPELLRLRSQRANSCFFSRVAASAAASRADRGGTRRRARRRSPPRHLAHARARPSHAKHRMLQVHAARSPGRVGSGTVVGPNPATSPPDVRLSRVCLVCQSLLLALLRRCARAPVSPRRRRSSHLPTCVPR